MSLKPTARRATVEDLASLRKLWEQLPTGSQLEPRVTEFQVLQGADGAILAAAGLQIAGTHAQLHHESFKDPAQSAELRPQLWERLLAVANNHGLVRLWTVEKGPFWESQNFTPATPELKKTLPPAFGSADLGWQTKQLRQEVVTRLSMEQELALFRDSQKQSSEKMLRQAQIAKMIALAIVAILVLVVAVGGLIMFRKYQAGAPGGPGRR